jgi:hypothetical protein
VSRCPLIEIANFRRDVACEAAHSPLYVGLSNAFGLKVLDELKPVLRYRCRLRDGCNKLCKRLFAFNIYPAG